MPNRLLSRKTVESPRGRLRSKQEATRNSTSGIAIWRNIPRKSIVIFLLAVFCVFATFGLIDDMMGLGQQQTPKFVLSVLIIGLVSVCYAANGIVMRSKFWMAFFPILAIQILIMSWLNHSYPDASRPVLLNADAIEHLNRRLDFDGVATIVVISLGYTGFTYVFISEARRYLRAHTENLTLEGEMAAAREVQRVMVPEELPWIEGYALESVYRPASEVGGDFFQVIPLKSGRTLVVIGDVSGKGLRAAMIVSMIVGTLRAVSGFTEEPAEILAELNRRLAGRIHDGFATCLIVRLDEQGRLTLANAGHLPPYRNGIELPMPGALPLGMLTGVTYELITTQLNPGDRLTFVSDGVVEAQNKAGELLGFDRTQALSTKSAAEIVDIANLFGQVDDITVVTIEFQGTADLSAMAAEGSTSGKG